MIKKIKQYSKQKIEANLGIKVNMEMWVKVQEDWQEKESIIKNIQYKKIKKAQDKIRNVSNLGDDEND